jgi:hypothetical protein
VKHQWGYAPSQGQGHMLKKVLMHGRLLGSTGYNVPSYCSFRTGDFLLLVESYAVNSYRSFLHNFQPIVISHLCLQSKLGRYNRSIWRWFTVYMYFQFPHIIRAFFHPLLNQGMPWHCSRDHKMVTIVCWYCVHTYPLQEPVAVQMIQFQIHGDKGLHNGH